MNMRSSQWLPLLVVPLMVACGGGSTGGNTIAASPSTTPGTLVFATPARNVSLSAAAFAANLDATPTGTQLHALAAGGSAATPLKCGIDVYKIEFNTLGGAATPEAIRSSGALYVPTGTGCSGPRPILLYAHGTTTDKAYDISQLAAPNPANDEAALIAAVYASNGFIVVAPNYAGYDDSTLSYHPYLNAKQQSREMQDALAAARSALPSLLSPTGDAGILFVSGYSQGGHVAMATVRDLEAAGQTVAGVAPMSGPYAMGAFGDILFSGTVDIGATIFVPLLATSYQKAYGNLYATPADLFTPTYASGIDTLLPSTLSDTQLFTQGLLPQSALFNVAPAITALAPPSASTFGYGNPYLVNDLAHAQYLGDAQANPDGALAHTDGLPAHGAHAPQNTIRQALVRNDLRLPAAGSALPVWVPHAPMLLCLGGNDPVVFSTNTLIMEGYFAGAAGALHATPLIHVLNVDLNNVANPAQQVAAAADADPTFHALQQAFTGTYNASLGSTAASQQAALIAYHGTVAPFCTAASLSFFAAPR